MMFDPLLIPQSIQQSLKQGYSIRPISLEDYDRGILVVLRTLTTVGDVSRDSFASLINFWSSQKGTYFITVVQDPSGNVVACGTLFIECKLIHDCGKVGHIEDIAVRGDQQGLKLGKHIIACLTAIAKSMNCYKVILDCDEKNVGFYKKCGYSDCGVEMAYRF